MADQRNSPTPPCPWGAPVTDSPAWGSPLVTPPQPRPNPGQQSPRFSPYCNNNQSFSPRGQLRGQGHSNLQPQQIFNNSSPRGNSRGHQQFTPHRNNYQSPSCNSPSPHSRYQGGNRNSPSPHNRYQGGNHSGPTPSPHRHQLHNDFGFNGTPSSNHRFQNQQGSHRGQNGGSPRHGFRGRGAGNRQSFGSHFNPRAYVNASMLEDPWKNLAPTAMMKSY